MSQKRFLLPAFLAAVALLAGCSTTDMRVGRVIKAEDVNKIAPGKTTRVEILNMFGPPAAATITSEKVLSYVFVEARAENHTWIIPPLLVIYIDAVAANAVRSLVINFKNDLVVNYAFSTNSMMGAASAGSTEGISGMTLPQN
jgi:outer membrane protein assembly factor BamE (lipoprotein component of BamABCDE complex)